MTGLRREVTREDGNLKRMENAALQWKQAATVAQDAQREAERQRDETEAELEQLKTLLRVLFSDQISVADEGDARAALQRMVRD